MNPYIVADLRRDEGVIPHAYQDSLGYWTIGVGRLIDKRLHGQLQPDEIDLLLTNDVQRVDKELQQFAWYGALDEVRQAVVLNMAFNLGIVKFKGFVNTIDDIAHMRYADAAEKMLQSRWSKQVGQRALRLAQQMRTGKR